MERAEKKDLDLFKSTLAARPAAVIIGGNWSTYAVNRGPPIDQHQTPIGAVPGAVLWANFAEAILDSRFYLPIGKKVLHGLEVLFSIVAALMLALSETLWRKFASLLALCLGLLSPCSLQYFSMRTFHCWAWHFTRSGSDLSACVSRETRRYKKKVQA
jgi:CHASE2 domain-containing sensor protein